MYNFVLPEPLSKLLKNAKQNAANTDVEKVCDTRRVRLIFTVTNMLKTCFRSRERVLEPACSHRCPSWPWALSVAAAASSTSHRSPSTLATTTTTATERRSHISKMLMMKMTAAW